MSYEDRSDAWLIRESFADPGFFDVLARRHYDVVHRVSAYLVGSSAAPDLAQETFLQAWRSRGKYDLTRPNARPWLLGIAHNLALHEYRRLDRERSAYKKEANVSEALEDVDRWVDVDDGLVAESNRWALREALWALPEAERTALVQVVLAELTYAEAAVELDVAEGTVKTRVMRAKKRMREKMESLGIMEFPLNG